MLREATVRAGHRGASASVRELRATPITQDDLTRLVATCRPSGDLLFDSYEPSDTELCETGFFYDVKLAFEDGLYACWEDALLIETFETQVFPALVIEPTSSTAPPRVTGSSFSMRIFSTEPVLIRIFHMLDGERDGSTWIIPLKCATTFDLDGLPPEICLEVRDVILNHVSRNKPEWICGDLMYPGNRASMIRKPYDRKEAEHKRYVCEALVPMKIPFLLSPRLLNRAYFGKHFKFATTTDLEYFLKGIGPVARRMLRHITICAYMPTSAAKALKLLADAEDLQTVHFTAICVAEAGCRRNYKRYPPESGDGRPFLQHFGSDIRSRSKFTGNCLRDALLRRPILKFDPHIAAYGSAFGAYLQDQPLYTSTLSPVQVSQFLQHWALKGIPLQQ